MNSIIKNKAKNLKVKMIEKLAVFIELESSDEVKPVVFLTGNVSVYMYYRRSDRNEIQIYDEKKTLPNTFPNATSAAEFIVNSYLIN